MFSRRNYRPAAFRLPLVPASLLLWMTMSVTSVHAQTIHVSIQGKPVEGKPIYWKDDFVALMERDGNLVTFAPNKASDYRQVSPSFKSHSQSDLRGELQTEFGRSFEVTGTGHYLVVHPAGQRDKWADRFEQLYRSMHHYFRARSFALKNPEFPLIAIVFPTQQSYLRFAQQNGRRVSSSTLGYYDPESNRIQMFDITANRENFADWYTNAETIIHEAAHQTAFNVGIHNRFAVTPRWLIEGLGTLFEAPGVWDSHAHPDATQRVNRAQLEYYR
ncbi:MAG: DUF1570 domain-containing protein, partial [Planctomycetales bacterium]|nr:DUF1570 domain-containing protein [Planctomycetales bacterium]